MLNKENLIALFIVLSNVLILIAYNIPNHFYFGLEAILYGILAAFVGKTYLYTIGTGQILSDLGVYLMERYDLGETWVKPFGMCAFCTAFLVGILLAIFTHLNLGLLALPFAFLSASVSANLINKI